MASQALHTGIEGATVIVYDGAEYLSVPDPLEGVARGRWSGADDKRWKAARPRALREWAEDLAWVDECGVCPLCRWVDAHPGETLPTPDELEWEEIRAELRGDPSRENSVIIARGRYESAGV